MHGIVDEKTDIFAFGVLLLEIVTGRRPVDSSKQNILLWVNTPFISPIKASVSCQVSVYVFIFVSCKCSIVYNYLMS